MAVWPSGCRERKPAILWLRTCVRTRPDADAGDEPVQFSAQEVDIGTAIHGAEAVSLPCVAGYRNHPGAPFVAVVVVGLVDVVAGQDCRAACDPGERTGGNGVA